MDSFDDQVDPDRVLPEAERKRRAAQARKAYFAGLALESAKARRQRKSAKTSERATSADSAPTPVAEPDHETRPRDLREGA
jgi:hypothetical protein